MFDLINSVRRVYTANFSFYLSLNAGKKGLLCGKGKIGVE